MNVAMDPKLDRWAVVQPPAVKGQEYMAPELRVFLNGCRLTGYVTRHPSLPDGPITTSRLVAIDVKEKVARTKNTTYRLADPDPDFVAWLKSQGKGVEDFVGEVQG